MTFRISVDSGGTFTDGVLIDVDGEALMSKAHTTPDGRQRVLRTFVTQPIFPGEACETRNAGGGGWGDPLRREPQRVLSDVRDGFVSDERGREVYGVIVNTGDWVVDEAATRKQRADLRSRRAAAGAPA